MFSEIFHPLIRSTNMRARFYAEFRKAGEIGAFPNKTSAMTVSYLVMARDHAKHGRGNFAKTG